MGSWLLPLLVFAALAAGAVLAAAHLRRRPAGPLSSQAYLAAGSERLEHERREYLKFLRMREQEVLTRMRTEPVSETVSPDDSSVGGQAVDDWMG
jgi:hypothetical protein